MGTKRIRRKWTAIAAGIVGSTVIAVAATLGVHFLQRDIPCSSEITYQDFSYGGKDGKLVYFLSPSGDVFSLDYTWGGPYWFSRDYILYSQSLDRQTAVCYRPDQTFFVLNASGGRCIEKAVAFHTQDDWEAYDENEPFALQISAYGDAVWFFTEESERDIALWRYDVTEDRLEQMDQIRGSVDGWVASPDGNYFAFRYQSPSDLKNSVGTVALYHQNGLQQTWEQESASPCFVTNEGKVFLINGQALLQSVGAQTQVYLPAESGTAISEIYWNQDGTEVLLTTNVGDTYFLETEGNPFSSALPAASAGSSGFLRVEGQQIRPYINEFTKIEEARLSSVNCYTMDIASFRDINLNNVDTGQRAKLTKDNTLVYQEHSELMHGVLAPSGNYMIYTDANGDYFYTDTNDIEGTYHLLWERSQWDVFSLKHVTGQKSFYYLDSKKNFHYTRQGRDVIICSRDLWETVSDYVVEEATDTCYFLADDLLYYSPKGQQAREILNIKEAFPNRTDLFTLHANAADGIYCVGTKSSTGEIVIYRLLSDGSAEKLE